VPLVVEPLLNDIRTGFDSKPVDEYFKLTGHDRFNIVPPGGESLRQYQSRVNQFIDRVLLDDGGRADQSILVVAHEETMRVFAARFESLPDHEWEAATFANCEFQCFSTP
jgi:broad specificity phosphatase PhoE